MTWNTLTPDHFAQQRARLNRQMEAAKDRHRGELKKELKAIEAELAKLDDLEKAVIVLASQKGENLEPSAPAASRGGRKYTADQDAEILATPVKKDLRRLAEKLGRSFEGVEKHRENLLKQQRAAVAAEPPSTPGHPDAESQAAKRSEEAADGGQALDTGAALRPVDGAESGPAARRSVDVAGAGSADSRERPARTPQPPARPRFDNRDAMEWQGSERNRPRPGTPVRGLTDDGPEHQRHLDPSAFSSQRRDG